MASGNVTGLDQWIRNLHIIERDIQTKVEKAVEAAPDDQLSVTNPLTPVRTGLLKSRNQKRMVERGPTRYVSEYFNDAPYAIFVFMGTYKMRARDAVTPGFYYARKQLLARLGRI